MTPVDPLPAERELEAVPAPDPGALDDSPRWPVTTLVGLSLTVALAVFMVAPAAIAGVGGARWVALVLPGLLATVTARVVFEGADPGGRRNGLRTHLAPALVSATIATLLMTASALIVGLSWSLATAVITGALCACVLVAAGLLRDVEVRVRLALRRVYFVGSAEARRDLEQELRRRSDASFVGASAATVPPDATRLVAAVRDAHATVLVIDRDAMREPAFVEAASRLNLDGLHVRDLVSYYESEFKKVPLGELSPTWFLFDIAPIHRRGPWGAIRRGSETALATVLFVLLSPLLLAAMLAVRLTSPGPALYRQRRVGKGGAQLTLLKLRTMTVSDETHSWAPSQDHRVTPVGRILRRFRLDEVPQLWNVIRGDLALIGPRPEQVPIVQRLEAEIPFYSARHCIRPGLTGWAQVNLGYAGSVEGTIAKLQRDLYYIKHAGVRLDALILWMTLKTVVSGRG
jgi:lipopolysaccharide/colanic/teichoic acid biosynthesis glycosyltransferase